MSPKMIKKKRKKKKSSVVIKYIELLEKRENGDQVGLSTYLMIENAFILPTHVDIKLF